MSFELIDMNHFFGTSFEVVSSIELYYKIFINCWEEGLYGIK